MAIGNIPTAHQRRPEQHQAGNKGAYGTQPGLNNCLNTHIKIRTRKYRIPQIPSYTTGAPFWEHRAFSSPVTMELIKSEKNHQPFSRLSISLFQDYSSSFLHSTQSFSGLHFLKSFSWKKGRALSSPVTMELTIEARRHK